MNLNRVNEVLSLCIENFSLCKNIKLIKVISLPNKEYNIKTELICSITSKIDYGDIYISDLSYDTDLFGYEIKLCKKTNNTLNKISL